MSPASLTASDYGFLNFTSMVPKQPTAMGWSIEVHRSCKDPHTSELVGALNLNTGGEYASAALAAEANCTAPSAALFPSAQLAGGPLNSSIWAPRSSLRSKHPYARWSLPPPVPSLPPPSPLAFLAGWFSVPRRMAVTKKVVLQSVERSL